MRRFLATLLAASTALSPLAAQAQFVPIGANFGGGSGGGGLVGSMTVTNTLASATPGSSVPKLMPQVFAPGAVPVGSIAVPSVAGTALRYQADKRLYWPDGSLKYAVFTNWLPQLAANGTEQVKYNVQAGSYNNTSGRTTAQLAADSNYVATFSNEAQFAIENVDQGGNGPAVPPYTVLSPTISGGQLTSVTPTHGGALGWTCASPTYDGCNTVGLQVVAPGATTLPAISVSFDGTTHQASTVTVTSPGAGIVTDGSGNYQCSFNSMISSGTVEQTAAGSSYNEYDVWGPATDVSGGAPHPWLYCHTIVGEYLNSDGSVYATRGVVIPTNGVYKPAGVIPPLMYTASFKNGSTCLVGACAGNPLYDNIQHTTQGAWATVDPNAQVYNSVNDAALKGLVLTPNAADKGFMKASGVIPPYDDTAPAEPNDPSTNGTTPLVLTASGSQNPTNDICTYYPFNFGCTDGQSGWGDAGTHWWPGALPDNFAQWYDTASVSPAASVAWAQQIREAAASSMHVLGGAVEPTTGESVNIISASQFPSMTYRPNANSRADGKQDMASTGIGSFQQGNIPDSFIDWGHVGEFAVGAILTDGEQWEFDALQLAGSLAETSGSLTSRDVTLTGTHNKTFNGLTADTTGNGIREAAWAGEAVAMAADFLPSYFADQPYLAASMNQNFEFMRDITENVGTVQDGNTPVAINQLVPFTLVGYMSVADRQTDNGSAPQAQFMRLYHAQDLLYESMLLNKSNDDLNHVIQYDVANAVIGSGSSACEYDDVNYVMDWFQDSATLQHPLTNWNQRWNLDQRVFTNVVTTAGSNEIAADAGASFDFPLGSGRVWQDGTKISPVNIDSPNETQPNPYNVGAWPPPPSQENVTYYYHAIDATHGTVWQDAAFTQPATFTAATHSEWGVQPAPPAGFACANAVPGYATADWENPGGVDINSLDSRQAQLHGVAEFYEAAYKGVDPVADTNATTIINNTANFYPAGIAPYWRYKTYTPGN